MNEDIFNTNEGIIETAMEATKIAIGCMMFAKEAKMREHALDLPSPELIDMAIMIYSVGMIANEEAPHLYENICDMAKEEFGLTEDEAD